MRSPSGLNLTSLIASACALSITIEGSLALRVSQTQIVVWLAEVSSPFLFLFQLSAKLSSCSPVSLVLSLTNSFCPSSFYPFLICEISGRLYRLIAPVLVILATTSPSGMHRAFITSWSWENSLTISSLLRLFWLEEKESISFSVNVQFGTLTLTN